MDQEEKLTVHIFLTSQRGLRYCIGWPILQTLSPSGGGAPHVYGSTTYQSSVSISIANSKYCCSISLYVILIKDFFYPFIHMECIAYFISFFFHETNLICITIYFYIKYDYSLFYCSFYILFISSGHCFYFNVYFYYQLFFCQGSNSMLNYKYFCINFHDSFTIFFGYSINLTF